MRKLLPALAAALAAGCGYNGEPLPPLAAIPAAVSDFSAVERGARIAVQFTVPKLTTEGMPVKPPVKLDLRIGQNASPFSPDQWAETARLLSPGDVKNGRASYEIPIAAWIGTEAVIGVRTIGANGKASAWALATVPVIAPLEIPTDIQAEATVEGVRVSWQGRGSDFRVFRRAGADDFVAMADAPQAPWIDHSTEFGKSYTYRVQAIARLADNHEAQSDPSADFSITPEDRFPPAIPAGVRASASAGSVELSWEPDTDADLAGYHVYRAPPGGTFERIADSNALPSYSDRNVEHGKTYRYAVTAVDRSGNESQGSTPVEVAVE